MKLIETQRVAFDIPSDIAYFNCAYMSPLMRKVVDAGHQAVSAKSRPWETVPQDFFTDSEKARGLFAQLIGAGPDDIAIIPSVSYGIAIAARNLPLARGQSVLCIEEQFPSNIYSWRELAAQRGGKMVTVPRATAQQQGEITDWTPAVIDAIDQDTAIVTLPHCHWADGSLLDLKQISHKAKAMGAALVLDVTQSCGAMPLSVADVDADFIICATYKWLLGPYSMGFIYVAPRQQAGTALEQTWIARANSQDFAALAEYQDTYQPGARRFDMGERSNFQLLPMVIAALEQIHRWGVEEIAATLGHRTNAIATRAASLGLRVLPAAFRAPHFLGLRFGGPVPEALLEILREMNVFASVRGQSLRITPHLHNTDDDVERLFAALEKALG
ncbi:MAG: aminotransferase class V-fold PLP-dependent enzyme [Alphaproteobacteria bacterium]